MSDPFGHGETCDCKECMAYSHGFEAGKEARYREFEYAIRLGALSNEESALREFGVDGWELVAVVPTPAGTGRQYYFKRPKRV